MNRLPRFIPSVLLACTAFGFGSSEVHAAPTGHGGHGGGAGHLPAYRGGPAWHGAPGYRGGYYGGYGGYYGYPYYGYGLGLGVGVGVGYGYGYGGYGYGGGGYGYGYAPYGAGYGSPYYPPNYYPGNYGPPPEGGYPPVGPPPGSPLPGAMPPLPPLPVLVETEVTLIVRVPAEAVVWMNGAKTTQTGTRREFTSSGMTPGRNYTFHVRAQWTGPNGVVQDQDRSISVQAGERRAIDFSNVPSSPGDVASAPIVPMTGN